jgi:hypothetical protein
MWSDVAIREVAESSNNTKKANTAMRRLINSQKQVTITKYFSESPLRIKVEAQRKTQFFLNIPNKIF